MPFVHKFQNHDFKNGFQTHNAILDVVPYEPEVLFIGTSNHGWSWNLADFYYGRGMYMWTVMGNLFIHGHNHLSSRRDARNLHPTLGQLFEICIKGRFVFGDIVKGISRNIAAIEAPEEKYVLVNGEYIWRTHKDTPLDEMGAFGWLDDNVDAIISYINNTPSLKHIYFTYKSGAWINVKKSQIIQGIRRDVTTGNIFTPSMNGFGQTLPPPFHQRAWSLAHCWVWNGLPHAIPSNRAGYTHLSHEWLRERGVEPNNF